MRTQNTLTLTPTAATKLLAELSFLKPPVIASPQSTRNTPPQSPTLSEQQRQTPPANLSTSSIAIPQNSTSTAEQENEMLQRQCNLRVWGMFNRITDHRKAEAEAEARTHIYQPENPPQVAPLPSSPQVTSPLVTSTQSSLTDSHPAVFNLSLESQELPNIPHTTTTHYTPRFQI